MPKSNHIHKSMLLRGVKFAPPALNAADIEATKGRAARSGRSNGGVPLQGDGRRNNGINYGSSNRNGYPQSNGHQNSWQPPPPGMQGFGRGPPPPPPPGAYSNYNQGAPGHGPPGYGGYQPRGPPPGYEGNNRYDADPYGRDRDRNGGGYNQGGYRGGGNFYRGR